MIGWVAVSWVGFGSSCRGAGDDELSGYEKRQQAETKERAKDPAWRPALQEVRVIRAGEGKKGGALESFCVAADGNLLACWSDGGEGGKAGGSEVRVFSPAGQLVKAVPLPVPPGAICIDGEGNWLVGGGGKLLKLDPQGKLLVTVDSPAAKQPVELTKEMEQMLKEAGASAKEEIDNYKRSLAQRAGEVTGIATTGKDVFVACPSTNDFGYSVWRLDTQLGSPQRVAEKLRGCCGQMDIQARDGKLWVAHNARHRVECRDRDGKELAKFGKEGRTKAEHFGGCCEPKNLRLTAAGDIFTAESGPPTCVKRFSSDGKFLGVVAMVEGDIGCVRVCVDTSPDGKTIYLLDTGANSIRAFAGQPGA